MTDRGAALLAVGVALAGAAIGQPWRLWMPLPEAPETPGRYVVAQGDDNLLVMVDSVEGRSWHMSVGGGVIWWRPMTFGEAEGDEKRTNRRP